MWNWRTYAFDPPIQTFAIKQGTKSFAVWKKQRERKDSADRKIGPSHAKEIQRDFNIPLWKLCSELHQLRNAWMLCRKRHQR